MGVMSVVQTIWPDTWSQLSQTMRLSVRRGANPRLILDDTATDTRTVVTLDAAQIDPNQAQITTLAPPEARFSVSVNGHTGTLPAQVYDIVGESGQAYLNEVGFAGNLVAYHRMTVAGSSWLILSMVYGQGLSSYRIGTDGARQLATRLDDTGTLNLKGITALESVRIDGSPYIIAASQREDSIAVLKLGSSGQLWPVDQLGKAQEIPIDRPSALRVVTLGDTHFVITASYGTASVTVLRIGTDGRLSFADQLIDTLGTRFRNAAALDVAVLDDRAFLAVAGADGGVTLMQMLPNGRLVLRDTLIDQLDTALDAVSALRFVQTSAGLELFALSQRDNGLTRLHVDTGVDGISGAHARGTAAMTC